MPRVVGSFISRHVYDGKLETVHAITSASACRFVDVQKGREKQEGHSWIVLRSQLMTYATEADCV